MILERGRGWVDCRILEGGMVNKHCSARHSFCMAIYLFNGNIHNIVYALLGAVTSFQILYGMAYAPMPPGSAPDDGLNPCILI